MNYVFIAILVHKLGTKRKKMEHGWSRSDQKSSSTSAGTVVRFESKGSAVDSDAVW